jgi:predicted glycosyltransferase
VNIQWEVCHTYQHVSHWLYQLVIVQSVPALIKNHKGCYALTCRTFSQERVEINRSNFVVPTVANTWPDAILSCIAKACGFPGMA